MNIYPTGFYVYAYLRKSDSTPYYIGKGQRDRAWSKYHNLSLPNDNTKIIILEQNLSEIGALALERRYIKWYGRKDIGTGILRNLTDGGDGASGAIRSEEFKQSVSQRFKGRTSPTKGMTPWNKGIRASTEHKKNVSQSLKGHVPWNKGIPSEKLQCPHCNKIGGTGPMRQWHFNNCKFKI